MTLAGGDPTLGGGVQPTSSTFCFPSQLLLLWGGGAEMQLGLSRGIPGWTKKIWTPRKKVLSKSDIFEWFWVCTFKFLLKNANRMDIRVCLFSGYQPGPAASWTPLPRTPPQGVSTSTLLFSWPKGLPAGGLKESSCVHGSHILLWQRLKIARKSFHNVRFF